MKYEKELREYNLCCRSTLDGTCKRFMLKVYFGWNVIVLQVYFGWNVQTIYAADLIWRECAYDWCCMSNLDGTCIQFVL